METCDCKVDYCFTVPVGLPHQKWEFIENVPVKCHCRLTIRFWLTQHQLGTRFRRAFGATLIFFLIAVPPHPAMVLHRHTIRSCSLSFQMKDEVYTLRKWDKRVGTNIVQEIKNTFKIDQANLLASRFQKSLYVSMLWSFSSEFACP